MRRGGGGGGGVRGGNCGGVNVERRSKVMRMRMKMRVRGMASPPELPPTRAGDSKAERARKLRRRLTRDYDAEAAAAAAGKKPMMQKWSGPKVGLALGRRMDMVGGDVPQSELVNKDSVFDDYARRGNLPGFDGNIRDLTTSIYNDPDNPSPRRLSADAYPLTSYDKRRGFEPAPSSSSGAAASRPTQVTDASTRAGRLASYDEVKRELQYTTGATGLLGTPLICSVYSLDAGASFALGAGAAMVYVRALAKFSDALPSTSSPGANAEQNSAPVDAVGGLVGSQRLLIPVLLVLICNRFNTLYADELNLHLQVLFAIAGFFSYKVSAVVQALRDIGLIGGSTNGGPKL